MRKARILRSSWKRLLIKTARRTHSLRHHSHQLFLSPRFLLHLGQKTLSIILTFHVPITSTRRSSHLVPAPRGVYPQAPRPSIILLETSYRKTNLSTLKIRTQTIRRPLMLLLRTTIPLLCFLVSGLLDPLVRQVLIFSFVAGPRGMRHRVW